MTIAGTYLSLSQYAEKRGSSDPTLKKLMDQAKGTPYDMGEPDGEYGKTKIWHIDKWKGLEFFRLSDAISEAVGLGFVMTMEAANEWGESRYADGYQQGREDFEDE